MASAATAESSRSAKQDDQVPSTDELTALASQLALPTSEGSTASITQRFADARQQHVASQHAVEAALLAQAPAYLKLHNDVQASKALLGELESFLDVFYTDLSMLSSQMSALQGKSIALGQRLKNRRQLEAKVRTIVTDIVLEPRYIDLIFADEATAGRAGLEMWKGCAERLSACLMACTELEAVLRDELALPRGSNASIDVKALREARDVAEACRVMAVSKIRPLLISTFAPLRTSLSTNLPILQAILLKSYRPLFMFLSHHAPRVAIDVQRAYVAAARLYFETGFRRYARSLGRLRDREKAKSGETGMLSSSVSFTDAAGGAKAGGSGIASALPPMFGGGASTSSDPWAPDAENLENAKIVDGPAVTLAYLADDSAYRASVESLFRSLSLTFLDNASSEYCFLARFFEGIDLDVSTTTTTTTGGTGSKTGSLNSASQRTGTSVVKVTHADAAGADSEQDEGLLPEDSASAQGDDSEADGARHDAAGAHGTVVRLSDMEKTRIRGRGALDELWKQVMDPVTGTYTTFVNSIVALHPPLLPLYTMLKLNDRLLVEVEERGLASVLQGTFIAFKLKAWPMLQKQFDEAVESVKKVRLAGGGAAAGGAATGMGAAASSLLGGFFGGGATQAAGGTSAGASVAQLVCARYAGLYSSIVQLNSSVGGVGGVNSGDDDAGADATIFASLSRLRVEVEGVLDGMLATKGAGANEAQGVVASCHQIVRHTLETGPAAVSLARIQSEMSHWTEAERSRLRGGGRG